jgi:ArsR family transcriptional regulator, arsenate/arsenite/antimonite-responsive transcriptional repressor
LNTVFKALNDPIRREILTLLKKGDMTAGEIADHFQIGKPTLSHHLDLLRQADLVSSRKDGQFVVYSLSTTVLDEILQWMYQLSQHKQ